MQILKLPRFFTRMYGEWKNAAISNLSCSYTAFTIASFEIYENLENASFYFMKVGQRKIWLIVLWPLKRVLFNAIWPKGYQMKAEGLFFKLIPENFENFMFKLVFFGSFYKPFFDKPFYFPWSSYWEKCTCWKRWEIMTLY